MEAVYEDLHHADERLVQIFRKYTIATLLNPIFSDRDQMFFVRNTSSELRFRIAATH